MILSEATPAVHAIPRANRVERVGERLVAHDATRYAAPLLSIVQLVEEPNGEAVEDPGRPVEAKARLKTRRRQLCRSLRGLRPAAGHQDTAPHVLAPCETVDPPHRVGPIRRGIFEGVLKLVDVTDAAAFLPDPLGRDAPQPELDLEHVACEPHATDRGSKQIRMPLWRALEDASVGDAHLQRRDVIAEVAVLVLILAVHVRRDHAAECDETRAWRYRREEPPWHEEPVELSQRKTRLGAKRSRCFIEAENPVGIGRVEDVGLVLGRQR